jgi:hypothetical protein
VGGSGKPLQDTAADAQTADRPTPPSENADGRSGANLAFFGREMRSRMQSDARNRD